MSDNPIDNINSKLTILNNLIDNTKIEEQNIINQENQNENKNNEESNKDLFQEERIRTQNFKISESSLINSNLNPIIQYNYFIDICNLSYNRQFPHLLKTIPINCFISNLYDFYLKIFYFFKFSIFCLLSNGCKYLMRTPTKSGLLNEEEGIDNKINKPKTSCWKILLGFVYLIFSLVLFVFFTLIFIYGMIVLVFPHTFFTIYLLIGWCYHLRNKNTCNGDFISAMIYDDKFIDDQIMNYFIIINNQEELDNYKLCNFYDELKNKYMNKDNKEKPQKFCVIGKKFKAKGNSIFCFLASQIFAAIIMIGGILLINKKFEIYWKLQDINN